MMPTIARRQLPLRGLFTRVLAAALIAGLALPARGAFAAEPSPINTSNTVSNGVAGKQTLVFSAGYDPVDWGGYLVARPLNADGSFGTVAWDAGKILDATAPESRIIFSARFNPDGSFGGALEFKEFGLLDAAAKVLLMQPPAVDGARDTGQARLDWIRGGRIDEANGTLRQRATILGALVHSQPVYVAYPAEGYRNHWPVDAGGQASPESAAADHPVAGTGYVSYEQFARDQRARRPVVYVGSNDGMLHAFDATRRDDGSPGHGAGKELWAYVPRSAYEHLGELTRKADPRFIPVVDATPVSRDVFFPQASTRPTPTSAGWHTIIVGGLGRGGRGVYALDVTQPGPASGKAAVPVADAVSKVLWEFEAGMPAVGTSDVAGGTNQGGSPADLGYTYGQPNIGRLANGRWVVLIPSGILPVCVNAADATACAGNGAAHAYSALFVVDAQTGALITELKTPTSIPGVVSYALSSPVLGDYNDDQIDDVAFAGDGAGNLWRYDLAHSDPAQWTVKLAYRPETPGSQPIAVMPRLLPDPATNRFIIVFGTGGTASLDDTPGQAGASLSTQAVYGIRDTGGTVMGTQNLIAQTLIETAGSDGGCSGTHRSLTNHVVPIDKDGWYFNLIAPGERAVVSAGALFDTNRLVITTLIDGSASCSGKPQGAVMIVDAANGGAGDGISLSTKGNSLGSSASRNVGGRINNPPLAGIPPVAGAIGGGQLIFPGMTFTNGAPVAADDGVWRRRSWRELFNVL